MSAPDQWASYLDPDTPPDERAEIGSNLDESDVAALDGVGRILADEAVWGGPSAGLRDDLLAQAQAEKATAGEGRSPAHGEQVVDELSERRSRRRLGLFGGGLVAAAAAVAVLVLAVRSGDEADFTTFELAATELTPELDATVDVRPLPAGVALTLHIKGLPPAEEGTYYAAWLMPDTPAMEDDESMSDKPMVGVGSFHWREGGIPIGLWSGVDTDRFPIFVVTLQDEDAPPIASDVVVMTGRLTGG